MKYSSTIRLINVIVCALLAAGFGYLAIYFGFLIAPYLWVGKGPIEPLPEMGLALPLMLGSFGLAGLLVSLYGLGNAVLSMIKEREDKLVVRTFGSYIAIGYLIAIFCLFNSVWLYRLTSSNLGFNDTAFVIVVFAVLFLVALIVSNIPVLKLFGETEELNKVMMIVDGAVAAGTLSIGFLFGLCFLVYNGSTGYSYKDITLRNMGVAALLLLIAGALSCAAFVGYMMSAKKGTISKKNGLLFEGSLLFIGGSVIFAGIVEWFSQSKDKLLVSFVGKTVQASNSNYLDFCVVAWIFGSLIILGALYLAFNTVKGGKKQAE